MYEDLTARLAEIVQLAQSVPAEFQEKCFELLLSAAIRESPGGSTDRPETVGAGEQAAIPRAQPAWTVPARVRTFLARQRLSEEDLRAAVIVEGKDVHFVAEPSGTSNAARQLDWAVLLALKSALLGGAFETDAESVRSICQEKGCYDVANFAAHFKKRGRELFRDALEPQGASSQLDSAGEKRLADFVRRAAGTHEQ